MHDFRDPGKEFWAIGVDRDQADMGSDVVLTSNTKYAQMALTILRAYYNFYFPYKTPDGDKLTPAHDS
jgi:basic membrane lipoprotein Med (substrate-binding protein (PBP1-ABC) superfamily)